MSHLLLGYPPTTGCSTLLFGTSIAVPSAKHLYSQDTPKKISADTGVNCVFLFYI